MVRGVVLQALFIMLTGACGYLAPPVATVAFLAAFVLYGSSGNAVSNLWMSWMGDLVAPEIRGRLFAWRGRIFSAVSLSVSLAAGFLARTYTTDNAPWAFFTTIFALAGVLRLASAWTLTKQYEPSRAKASSGQGPLKLSREFVVFITASALLNGGAALAGPFFNVWFLRDLHFDYFSLSISACATVSGSIVSLPMWGKLADTMGNRRIMLAAALLVAMVPLPYLVFDTVYMVWAFNFFSGFAWAGYNLSSFNFMLAAAGQDRPERAFSYSVMATAVSVFLFGLLGGWLVPRLPAWLEYQLQSIFLLSGLVRLSVVLVIFRLLGRIQLPIREGMSELFNQLPGYRQGLGVLRGTFRAFRRQ